jgi:hypothetical protein
MSTRIYQPESQSKAYLYIVFFTAVFLAITAYYNFRFLEIQNQCSEIALKTSNLTRSFKFDPESEYDFIKANCEYDVLSSKK